MASSDADLKTVKDDLNQLRADVRSLAETMQTTAKDRAASAKTRVKEGVDQGKDQLMAAEQKAEQQIAAHPLQSVGIAFGAGFLIGRLAGR
ncbi:hypothetical protein [Abyssibacter sp.]|jgi:ElaB/YqjD/DUF883 family membrane-anchored ribosome-binding protein|uniref:DUF883 family protein n=1 Tax=Abyssibacter sp. TaxID=2320200 RepID=UPI0025BCDA9E|nr:hypothetical protein [Abyssibacter sp.]MCK5858370.1 DUF883 family protein [Abyssibacter sp.]